MEELGRQTIIAHNDPSPARERVLRLYEQRHAPINIQVGLPSLDGIKRGVEMGLGVALLPRRCALSEIANGQLAAVKVPQLRLPRHVRLVYRRSREDVARCRGVPQARQRTPHRADVSLEAVPRGVGAVSRTWVDSRPSTVDYSTTGPARSALGSTRAQEDSQECSSVLSP